MPQISKYIHSCIVRYGDLRGNKYLREVSVYDIESREECPHCGEPLATSDDILMHIYRELTE